MSKSRRDEQTDLRMRIDEIERIFNTINMEPNYERQFEILLDLER